MSTSELEKLPEKMRIVSQDHRGIVLIDDMNEDGENAPLSLKELERKDRYDLAYKEGWEACRKENEEKEMKLTELEMHTIVSG